jgi:hypothetical protein
MRSMLVRLLIVLALAALSAPAGAHDHNPPDLKMKVDGKSQEGKLVYTSWFTTSGEACVHGDLVAPDAYPDAIAVSRGDHLARVRINKRHRPDYLEVYTWQAVTPEGGAGPADVLDHRLKPIRRDGRVVAFRVLFDVTVVKDLYVKVRAAWPDIEGCSPQESAQQGHWNFHLEAEI